jgi:hypothetical protein
MIDAENLADFIRHRLPSPDAKPLRLDAYQGFVRPDLAFDDGKTLFVVEVKRSTPSPAVVAQLHFQGEYLLSKLGLESRRSLCYVIAAPSISKETDDLLDSLKKMKKGSQVLFLRLNPRLLRSTRQPRTTAGGKITSPSAWRVVFALLRSPASIRSLSLTSGVSYAWCHRTVSALIMQGLARQRGGKVEVTDVNRLLSGAAWERPLLALQRYEVTTASRRPVDLARELSRRSEAVGALFAVTGPAHLLLSSDYTRSVDRLDIYLSSTAPLEGLKDEGGIRVHVYNPDRQIDIERRDGVPIVSPSQAVLDLAGMGRDWFELALAAVKAGAR